MENQPWNRQAILVCVDGYENGVPRGRLSFPGQPGERFASLSQLLIRVEWLLEQSGGPQSFTIPRIFALVEPPRSRPRQCGRDDPGCRRHL